MNRVKLAIAFKRVCNFQEIILSRTDRSYHLNKLQLENIPDGISSENLDEIILDYLQEKKLLKLVNTN